MLTNMLVYKNKMIHTVVDLWNEFIAFFSYLVLQQDNTLCVKVFKKLQTKSLECFWVKESIKRILRLLFYSILQKKNPVSSDNGASYYL